MHPTTTIGDAIAQLEREIEERQRTLSLLRQLVAVQHGPQDEGPATRAIPESQPRSGGPGTRPAGPALSVGAAAAEVLKSAGRPMHGIRELLPILQEKGVTVSKNTLPTALARQKDIERSEAGTWRYREGGADGNE